MDFGAKGDDEILENLARLKYGVKKTNKQTNK